MEISVILFQKIFLDEMYKSNRFIWCSKELNFLSMHTLPNSKWHCCTIKNQNVYRFTHFSNSIVKRFVSDLFWPTARDVSCCKCFSVFISATFAILNWFVWSSSCCTFLKWFFMTFRRSTMSDAFSDSASISVSFCFMSLSIFLASALAKRGRSSTPGSWTFSSIFYSSSRRPRPPRSPTLSLSSFS